MALSYNYSRRLGRRGLASARCLPRHVPDIFFPVGTHRPALSSQIEAAKAVCRRCEVQAPCLEFALATNQEAGVWGGTAEDERRSLRKQWLAARRRRLQEATAAALTLRSQRKVLVEFTRSLRAKPCAH